MRQPPSTGAPRGRCVWGFLVFRGWLRSLALVAVVVALGACSDSNDSDVEELRAEVETLRADVAALESASPEIATATPSPAAPLPPAATLEPTVAPLLELLGSPQTRYISNTEGDGVAYRSRCNDDARMAGVWPEGAEVLDWDIISLDFSGAPAELIANPGGVASARSGDVADAGGMITMTGSGTFVVPGGGRSDAATGGGTWETFDKRWHFHGERNVQRQVRSELDLGSGIAGRDDHRRQQWRRRRLPSRPRHAGHRVLRWQSGRAHHQLPDADYAGQCGGDDPGGDYRNEGFRALLGPR